MSLSDEKIAHSKYNNGEEYIDYYLYKEDKLKQALKKLLNRRNMLRCPNSPMNINCLLKIKD